MARAASGCHRAREVVTLGACARARNRVLPPGAPLAFPDPASSDGLLAIGGDSTAERLLFAYEHGIFPWYDEGLPPTAAQSARGDGRERAARVAQSAQSAALRGASASASFLRDFSSRDAGMRARGNQGPGFSRDGRRLCRATRARARAQRRGWRGESLGRGGLYGVQRGALFAAESMFHRERDASKVALVSAVEFPRGHHAVRCAVSDAGTSNRSRVRNHASRVPRAAA